MFDINDFDETLPGPWEWDVKRLAASFEVGGRDARASARRDRRDDRHGGGPEYRRTMRRAAKMRALDVWYDHVDVETIARRGARRRGAAEAPGERPRRGRRRLIMAKARTRDHLRAFSKRVGKADGELRFVADPPLVVPIHDLAPPGTEHDELDAADRRRWSARTGARWRASTTRSRSTAWSTRRARSSVSGASARSRGSTSSSAATGATR